MIEGPSGQRTLTRGVVGRGKGHESASDPSRRAPRAFLRLERRAAVHHRLAKDGGFEWPRSLASGRPKTFRPLQSSAIREHDPGSKEPRAAFPRLPSEPALSGWSRLFWRRLQPGCCAIRGRIGFWGQSGAAPSRLLVRGAGLPRSARPGHLVSQVRGRGRVENPVLPMKVARSAPDQVSLIE